MFHRLILIPNCYLSPFPMLLNPAFSWNRKELLKSSKFGNIKFQSNCEVFRECLKLGMAIYFCFDQISTHRHTKYPHKQGLYCVYGVVYYVQIHYCNFELHRIWLLNALLHLLLIYKWSLSMLYIGFMHFQFWTISFCAKFILNNRKTK